ncbi:Hypothetical protein R9X50_00767000 [Acrodontium crateriforme]|uniref:Ribonuclease P/MRP protein subunit POP5 n=1 Tax=Acrodontium crateriforme TaxID=150365 RepID=A0AAQ3MBQ3_9PEZI|nr:Hypothetical protein R9X50_00767000 [Acrodontium crateriforme]
MVRIKHRYLLVNILYPDDTKSTLATNSPLPHTVQFHQPSPDTLTSKLLTRLLREGLSDYFGDYGAGRAAGSLQVKYFSPATSTAIIRVAREHYRLVWAVLTYLSFLPRPVERRCVMRIVRVSGTMRKAEEEAIRRARVAIQRATGVAKGERNEGVRNADMADWNGAKGIEDLDDDEEESDDGS